MSDRIFPRLERTPVEIAASVAALREELALAKRTDKQHIVVQTDELDAVYSALDLLTVSLSLAREALKEDGRPEDAAGIISDCTVALLVVGVVPIL